MAIATAAAMVIGSLISAGMTWYGMRKQEEHAGKIRAEDIGREDERYRTQLGMTRQQMRMTRQQMRKKWKWMEEERNYQRARDAANQFNSLLNAAPRWKQNLQRTWSTQ